MKALVLILRGLPAGAIGPYGNRWVETPTLNALATRGVVYDWHFAVHPFDPGFVWSSGRYPFSPPPFVQPGLIAVLQQASIATYLVTDSNLPIDGFDQKSSGEDWCHAIALALEALEKLSEKDHWLLWVDLTALQPPWNVSDEVLQAYFAPSPAEDEDEEEEEDVAEEYLGEEVEIEPLLAPEKGPIDAADEVLYQRIQTTFGAAVTQLDLMLEELLEAVAEDVLVVVTSDHGQALGEHGVVGSVQPWCNDYRLHEEIIHVPLILAGPGCPGGRRIEALTASVDLPATLAAHFCVPMGGNSHGHDLHPAALAEGQKLREYVCLLNEARTELQSLRSTLRETTHALPGDQRPTEWAIRTPEWFLRLPIHGEYEGATRRLYVKPDDRCEVNDVAQTYFEQADALERTLRAFVEATRVPGPLQGPPLEDEPAAENVIPKEVDA